MKPHLVVASRSQQSFFMSCVNPGYGCYCDAVEKAWREDSALLTEKSHLPVKQLSFGDTGDDEEDDYHTLWYSMNIT